jgi:hypothetical protein
MNCPLMKVCWPIGEIVGNTVLIYVTVKFSLQLKFHFDWDKESHLSSGTVRYNYEENISYRSKITSFPSNYPENSFWTYGIKL